MSSDEDGAALMASFKSGRPRAPSLKKKQAFSPSNFVSDQSSADEVAPQRTRPVRRKAVAVKVPPIRNKHEYTYYPPQEEVARILREFDKHGQLMYEVRMIDGVKKQVREASIGHAWFGVKELASGKGLLPGSLGPWPIKSALTAVPFLFSFPLQPLIST